MMEKYNGLNHISSIDIIKENIQSTFTDFRYLTSFFNSKVTDSRKPIVYIQKALHKAKQWEQQFTTTYGLPQYSARWKPKNYIILLKYLLIHCHWPAQRFIEPQRFRQRRFDGFVEDEDDEFKWTKQQTRNQREKLAELVHEFDKRNNRYLKTRRRQQEKEEKSNTLQNIKDITSS